MNLGSATDSTLTVRGRNNLFRGCTLKLHPTAANNWEWRENLFDGTSIAQYSVAVANSHNGYWQSTRMIPNSANDVVLGGLTYAEGPLGRFYQPAGSALTDAGSRTAAAAGLYHHTTTVDQAKDGPTTKVDIGFHYIALADGQPVDTDQEGLPDYVEDTSGDGVVQATETNPNAPDTDGDGLSDGAEVIASGTDPLDSDSDNDGVLDALEPGLDWLSLTMDPEHPCDIVAVTDAEGVTQRNVRRLLIPKGVDAIWLKAEASTFEIPEYFAEYNDQLSYHIRGPACTIGGRIGLCPQMPPGGSVTALDDTWVVYHSRAKETASWIEIEVTAVNVGKSTQDSVMTVRVASVSVDLVVPEDDRRVYSPDATGVLTHTAEATVKPHGSGTITSYLTGKLRFEIEAIGDSVLTWTPSGGVAARNPANGRFEATATFTNLPTQNSAFGAKQVRVFADGLWGADGQTDIRIFYPADACNHPGADPPPGQGVRPPNYFYYYMQTAAGTPTITDYGPYYHAGGVSQASLTYPYKYYAAYDTTKRATGQDIRSPGVNGGATLFYIDLFAWAARHERGHHKNWMRFWPQGIQGRTGDSDLGVGDYLPDVDEPTTLAPEGGPFLPTSLNSHANDGYDGQTADCERHNCNSIHAMPWNVGSANDHDWACPGSKYDQ